MKNIHELIPHAQDRAVVWKAVTHFGVAPDECFTSTDVREIIVAEYEDCIRFASVGLERITHELGVLGRRGLVDRLPSERERKSLGYLRINPDGWQEIEPTLKTTLEAQRLALRSGV